MAGLINATELTPADEGFQAMLDPAWSIWGPAGGYLAAIALRAAERAAPADHRPVTLSGQFIGRAAAGAAEVAVAPLKTGGSALWQVTLAQAGRPFFIACIWTTARRDPVGAVTPAMPRVPPPEALPDFLTLCAERGLTTIAFWRNLEARPVDFRLHGDPPGDGRLRRWFRFNGWAETANPYHDAARAALLLDVHVWPAHHLRLPAPPSYVAPSLDVTLAFHTDAPAGEWLLLDMDADIAGDGLVHGQGRVWTRDGRAIATGGGQCLAVAARA